MGRTIIAQVISPSGLARGGSQQKRRNFSEATQGTKRLQDGPALNRQSPGVPLAGPPCDSDGVRRYRLSARYKVHDTLPQASEDPGHAIDPGTWVLIKNFQRTKNDQPRWTGPYLVLLSTRSAVRVQGKKNWIHGVHCKRVPLPLPYDRWVQEGIPDSETDTVPRFLPFSDARLIGTSSERESDDLLQESLPPSVRLDTTEPELLFRNQTLPDKGRYNLRPRVMGQIK
ncbi:uncharacterized protein LOC144752201 isoform X2 [Lissotriton helveticus]